MKYLVWIRYAVTVEYPHVECGYLPKNFQDELISHPSTEYEIIRCAKLWDSVSDAMNIIQNINTKRKIQCYSIERADSQTLERMKYAHMAQGGWASGRIT